MAKSKKNKHEQEKRSEEEELEEEAELEDEYDEDEYDEDEYDEDDEDDEDDEYEEEDEGGASAFGMADEPEDPYWWTPHLALSLILIVSLLGFFGLFNPWLGFLAPHHDGHEEHGSDAPAAAATPATAAPSPEAPTPPKRQAAQDIMGARHILVAYGGAMRARPEVKRSKEEAKKRAAEAAAKAKKLGKPAERVGDWKKLVEEYSDEPGAADRGGDLGRFRKGSFHKDFVAGTEKLKVGEISGPVESPFGFHIIWRTF